MSKSSSSSKSGDHGEEITLTPADKAALDNAWASITDADIAASIQWLDETASDDKAGKTAPHVAE